MNRAEGSGPARTDHGNEHALAGKLLQFLIPERKTKLVGIVGYNVTADPKEHRSKEGSEMLVLSRKLGEKIYINENICITVVDIDRGKIRLGIEAPRNVPIFRQELLQENANPTPAEASVLTSKG